LVEESLLILGWHGFLLIPKLAFVHSIIKIKVSSK